MKKLWELLSIVVVTVIIWNLPTSTFGIDGLTVVQQRIIAIFVFATLVANGMYSGVGDISQHYDHHVRHSVKECLRSL